MGHLAAILAVVLLGWGHHHHHHHHSHPTPTPTPTCQKVPASQVPPWCHTAG